MPKSQSTHHGGHYQVGASYNAPDYVQQLQVELAQCRSLVAAQDAELDQLRRDNSKILNCYEEYRHENKTLIREHSGLSRELENIANLSNARGKELASAQAFLSKADNISVVEVRDLVDALNEEIFQAAASLGDCIVRRKYDLSDEDQRSYRKRLHPIVGKGLLQLLSAIVTESNGHVNPLVVQVVIQVFLANRCAYEIDGWDPNRPELSSGLKGLYREMRVVEQQSVFGRWRALTLAQIKTDFEEWRKGVLEIFELLLEIACWNTSSPSHFDAFRNRLATIFKAVNKLRQAIGQDITSADYRIYTVLPDRTFRSKGMEEVYGDGKKWSSGEPGIVLGTTALGLIKMSVPSDGHQDSRICVVLPKVVVNTSFGDIVATHLSSGTQSSPAHQQDGRG